MTPRRPRSGGCRPGPGEPAQGGEPAARWQPVNVAVCVPVSPGAARTGSAQSARGTTRSLEARAAHCRRRRYVAGKGAGQGAGRAEVSTLKPPQAPASSLGWGGAGP